jgi:hypothetical protein
VKVVWFLIATCVSACAPPIVVLKLTPEGLCGQRGQLLPVLGLEQAFDLSAGLGNVFAARARGALQPLLAVFQRQALQAQLQFQSSP